MKTAIKLLSIVLLLLAAIPLTAQKRDLDNYRLPDQRGVNDFEAKKDTVTTFDGVRVS